MTGPFRAPPATLDWTDERLEVRRAVEQRAKETFERAGFREIVTPVFEETALFARTSGEGSEVVTKEMYSFVDRGGRALSLRPEFTAGVMRAFLEHGMARQPQPVRLWSCGNAYRYNRAQRGRYREFVQFNAEAIGSADPAVDAELIALELRWLGSLGLDGLEVDLNSIDEPASRRAYVERLVTFLDANRAALAPEIHRLRDVNPLRVFDTKDERSREVLAAAPKITDSLSPAAAEHFAAVRSFLDARGIGYRLDPTLVRGLDYYTHTAWEVKWPPLGAQSTLGGGGRYDGFAEILGGPPTPGVGFAVGIDRVVLALEDQGRTAQLAADRRPEVFLIVTVEEARPALHALLDRLRDAGIRAEADLAGRSAKGQWKHADRLGARLLVLCDAEDWSTGTLRVRDREHGGDERLPVDQVAAWIEERTAR